MFFYVLIVFLGGFSLRWSEEVPPATKDLTLVPQGKQPGVSKGCFLEVFKYLRASKLHSS